MSSHPHWQSPKRSRSAFAPQARLQYRPNALGDRQASSRAGSYRSEERVRSVPRAMRMADGRFGRSRKPLWGRELRMKRLRTFPFSGRCALQILRIERIECGARLIHLLLLEVDLRYSQFGFRRGWRIVEIIEHPLIIYFCGLW